LIKCRTISESIKRKVIRKKPLGKFEIRATARLLYERPQVVRMWTVAQNWYLRYYSGIEQNDEKMQEPIQDEVSALHKGIKNVSK